MKTVDFSIIIPIRVETPYLRETLRYFETQTYKNFEVLVITDKISQTSNPAQKRNLGAKMAKGKYLAFLDDDSYPSNDWLKNALAHLQDPQVAAVCGPCLIPPKDSVYQKASGLVWASFLGSGGAGTYRNRVSSPRYVDDFPSVNLIVKKTDFNAVKGFDTHHWPGEDTILCLNLVHKLGKKIYYHPSIVVYHHRRGVVVPHLQQITRYALHRGNFARIFPKTSLRLGYLLPSFFLIYCLSLPLHRFFLPLYLYLFLMLLTFIQFIIQKNNPFVSFLATITIPITHLYYGILFMFGFFTPQLKFVAHKINPKNNKYLGG